MSGKVVNLIGAAVLVIVAVVFGFIGVKDKWFVSRCQLTTGEVNDVVMSSSHSTKGRRQTNYRVNFTYNVDGKDYQETDTLGHSVATGPAQVYYDPAAPDEGRLEKPSPKLDFLIAVGLLIGAGVCAFKGLRSATG